MVNAFSFLFITSAVTLPTAIASYSLVGEKVQKSLEPLLATPTTEGEILLGKSIAAFLPPIAAIYTGAVIFMTLIDSLTYSTLGYFYFPTWNINHLYQAHKLVQLGNPLASQHARFQHLRACGDGNVRYVRVSRLTGSM